MPRGVGIGAIKNRKLVQAKYTDKGAEIEADQLQQMSRQLDTFKDNLEEFAHKYKNEIKRDPRFRQQFQEMCASIGVDPLASSKGFWSEMLGVGDFYYEIAVQVVEICMATSHRNGGLMDVNELQQRLMKSRGRRSQEISQDDLLRAVRKLKTLGNGFSVIPVGKSFLVQSVPGELSMDHTTIIQLAQQTAYVTMSQLTAQGWDQGRAGRALAHLIEEGLVWVDTMSGEKQFWFPGIFSAKQEATE